MFGKTYSATIHGIDGLLVQVEADISDGLPSFDLVGIPASEVKEARARVRTAFKNTQIYLPAKRVTVNLSPADIRKCGSGFDLPIAISILAALGLIPQAPLDSMLICGELGLDGKVKAINGVLSSILCAKNNHLKYCIVPKDNQEEGACIEGISIIGIDTLSTLIELLKRPSSLDEHICQFNPWTEKSVQTYPFDFYEIKGQKTLKRALEIAASGMHNLLMIGPPGSGKSMAAKRLPSILPSLSLEESIEITKIYSVSGLLPAHAGLMTTRPFRSPHHTISMHALAGGGLNPRPGELSLASRGVLFLDELPEFSKNTLEVLRQPLEDQEVNISRLHGRYTFPAHTMLAAAMNACPCGYYPNLNRCTCRPKDVRRYLSKLSKPLLDRIDITVESAAIDYQELSSKSEPEASAIIRKRVGRTQLIQRERFKETSICFNSQMSASSIEKFCPLAKTQTALMKTLAQKYELTARGYHKILKVARTIADLEKEENILEEHLMEAFCYRNTCLK